MSQLSRCAMEAEESGVCLRVATYFSTPLELRSHLHQVSKLFKCRALAAVLSMLCLEAREAQNHLSDQPSCMYVCMSPVVAFK